MLPNDLTPTEKLQDEIAKSFKPTPTEIASRAYRETEDVPSFGPADRFAIMLSRINRTMGPILSDDDHAAVILACRRIVGIHRENELLTLWRVLALTEPYLCEMPAEVEAEIRKALGVPR